MLHLLWEEMTELGCPHAVGTAANDWFIAPLRLSIAWNQAMTKGGRPTAGRGERSLCVGQNSVVVTDMGGGGHFPLRSHWPRLAATRLAPLRILASCRGAKLHLTDRTLLVTRIPSPEAKEEESGVPPFPLMSRFLLRRRDQYNITTVLGSLPRPTKPSLSKGLDHGGTVSLPLFNLPLTTAISRHISTFRHDRFQ